MYILQEKTLLYNLALGRTRRPRRARPATLIAQTRLPEGCTREAAARGGRGALEKFDAVGAWRELNVVHAPPGADKAVIERVKVPVSDLPALFNHEEKGLSI